MNGDLVHPNWHVILLHYPIALLATGVVVEILSLFGGKGSFRAAGRWMILLGVLSSVPAALTGAYAFREEVAPGPIDLQQSWGEIQSSSAWTPEQWEFMTEHAWLNAGAVVLALVLVLIWIAAPRRARSFLYVPCLVGFIAVLGLLAVGSWHGGEAVYRFGTAVEAVEEARGGGGDALDAQPGIAAAPGETEHASEHAAWTVPRLEIHLLLAGFTIGLSIAALAVALRSWSRAELRRAERRAEERARGEPVEEEEPARVRAEEAPSETIVTVRTEPAITRRLGPMFLPSPRPVWFLAFLVAVATAFFGYWSYASDLTPEALEENVETIFDVRAQRLLAHVICGSLLVLLPLIGTVVGRLMRRSRSLALGFTLVIVAAAGLQIWFGLLLLFDSHHGPLFDLREVEAVPTAPLEPEPETPAEPGSTPAENGAGEEPSAPGIDGDVNVASPAPLPGAGDDEAPGELEPGEANPPVADGGSDADGGHDDEAEAESRAVVIRMTDRFTYAPQSATVTAGETVRWTNAAEVSHTVTADPEKALYEEDVELPAGAEPFDSGEIAPGATWEMTFTTPGLYRYFSIPHEQQGMLGQVLVEPPEPPSEEGANETEESETPPSEEESAPGDASPVPKDA